jgi:hypothetical protein
MVSREHAVRHDVGTHLQGRHTSDHTFPITNISNGDSKLQSTLHRSREMIHAIASPFKLRITDLLARMDLPLPWSPAFHGHYSLEHMACVNESSSKA